MSSLVGRPMFFILDGHALAYRHHFAHINRPLMTASGEATSAVFGFARTLMDILEKDKPFYLAVAFDEGLSGRDEMFSEYKGTREKMPDDLERQMARIHQVVQAFNIPILSLPGYEADDVMGTIARQAEEQHLNVRLITGDRDLLQLLSEYTTVRLAIPKPGEPDVLYDVAAFREKWSLDPIQLIDYKALVGDSSDNIPGVAGVGDKTATKLLQDYATLDNIYANIELIGKSLKQKLIDGREMAYLSQRLATIQRDVPILLDKARCVAHNFDKTEVERLFRELEFTSLYNQLGRLGVKPIEQLPLFGGLEIQPEPEVKAPPVELVPTIVVNTTDGLRELVNVLNNASVISFDTETTSTDQMSADLVGISLSVDGETGYYIPVGHREGMQLSTETVLDALRPALTNPKIPKAAHNATYDLVVLQRAGIDVTPITFDTMVAEWVRDPLSDALGLKRLVRVRLGKDMTRIEELIGTGKNQLQMSEVAIDRAAPYAAADAVFTHQLIAVLDPELNARPDDPQVDPLWGTVNPPTPRDVFDKIEMPLVPVIASMERAGVMLDTAFLRIMSNRLTDDLAALEDEIFGLSGGYGKFNINSPKQLNDVLFGKLGLKVEGLRKTSHGYTTDAAALDAMRGSHPIVDKILNFRELSKLKGTYVDALPSLINPATGRLHTSYNQTGASTGRMSSSNPNLQNIPIRTEVGREVRTAFIAPRGYTLLSVDYSQVELRIMAHITKEPTLLDAFRQGQDIHATTASLVYNVPLEQVTKEQRIFAKRVNFGILYGMGAFRLARDSDLTLAQANAFIKTYFERLPKVSEYLDKTKALARTPPHYLSTMFGRRRNFPGLFQGNRNIIAASEREAINMPIQGTAADIMKIAMIRLYDELGKRNLGAKLILQVHDELVLEVPEDRQNEVAQLVVDVMEGAAQLEAPLKANAQCGNNWRDLTAVN